MSTFEKDFQYYKFCAYGFLKNLRFFDAFLLLFFIENEISFAQIGILYACQEIFINVFEIPSGIIADSYGRKRSLLAAFLAYILSFLVFYTSSNFWFLLLAMILYGVGEAFRSGTHKGMIMDYLRLNGWEHQKVNYYGHTRSWSMKGSALSALFAGGLVMYSGSYRVVYLFALVPYFLNLINISTYPEAINYSIKGKRKGVKSLIEVFNDFWLALKQRSVFRIVNSTALYTAYLKSIKDYIQPILVQLAILLPILETMDTNRKSGLTIGIIYFIIFLINSSASKWAYKVTQLNLKRIGARSLLLGLSIGAIAGIFIYQEWWMLAVLLFILIYVIQNIRKPILTGDLADNVPNDVLTSVLSAQSFYRTIITSILALAIGFLADGFGIGVALVVISIVLLFFTLIVEMPIELSTNN